MRPNLNSGKYQNPLLPVADDFGLRRLSGLASSDLYEVVIERHMRSSTIMTSNRSIEEWGDLFDEVILAQSALDRFCHRAHQLVIEGESYWERMASGKAKRSKAVSPAQQNNRKLRLKKNNGRFPAGESFLKAMSVLSDHTFKLFVFVCFNADRETATYTASVTRLTAILGKFRTEVDRYIAELQNKKVRLINRIPYSPITFRVLDAYWPYECDASAAVTTDDGSYVDAVRALFLGLGCTSGRFGPSEARQARNLEQRGILLQKLEDAMTVGACRK
jgi:hypothetical protein